MQLQINESSVMTTAAAQIAYKKTKADLYRWRVSEELWKCTLVNANQPFK